MFLGFHPLSSRWQHIFHEPLVYPYLLAEVRNSLSRHRRFYLAEEGRQELNVF